MILRGMAMAFVLSSAWSFGDRAEPASHWTQKEFIVSFWCPPPATDENLSNVAKEGFNLTWVAEDGLDAVARHGLRAMLQSPLLAPEVLDDPAKRAELDTLIERVKKHPALEAYFITDEPGAGAFAGLGRLVAYLRERDPAHLAYINLYPTYASEAQLGVSADAAARAKAGSPVDSGDTLADTGTVLRYREHLRQYIEAVHPDLISYDHYHFLKNAQGGAKDGTEYFLNLGMIRTAALGAKRPFLNIIQADTISKNWRLPNAAEMRWLVFTTMAYGGRGISYFTYWGPKEYNGLYMDGKAAPLMKDVAQLNHEIAKFGPALLELNSVGVYQTRPLPDGAEAVPARSPVQVVGDGKFVIGIFAKEKRPSAFMIVNRDYKHGAEATVRIDLRGRNLQELDRETGQWMRAGRLDRKRELKLELAAGDGRLFRVQS